MNPDLHALLDTQPRSDVLADTRVESSLTCAAVTRLAEAELLARLQDSDATVVAVHTCSPTLLRRLRRRPPQLLVVTGPTLPQGIDCKILGPNARLRVSPGGDIVAFACSPDQLGDLLTQLEPATPKLALTPTPQWLVGWLDDSVLAACPTVGTIAPEVLNPDWPRWFRTRFDNNPANSPPPIVVPLGPPDVHLDRPGGVELLAAACAHTLESLTGPLVPVPALLARLVVTAPAPPQLSPLDLALWRQTRRGLPSLGSRVADTPQAPIAGQPILAVLAAKARAQQQRAYELLQTSEPDLDWPSEDLEARSLEVLRSAGEILSDHESKVVLRGFGIEITRQAVAASASGAVAFADKIGYPVVLKAVSPDFRRKREFGALMLDLQTAASVRRGYATIVRNLEEHAPTVQLDGVAVCEQIAEGLEVRCGAIALGDDAYAFYGMALGATGPTHSPMLAIGPLDWSAAMLLAGSILAKIPVPALRRRGDPQPETLAILYVRLNRLIEAGQGRLLKVDLSPIRLLDDPRAYVTLDARITQKPHLEGL